MDFRWSEFSYTIHYEFQHKSSLPQPAGHPSLLVLQSLPQPAGRLTAVLEIPMEVHWSAHHLVLAWSETLWSGFRVFTTVVSYSHCCSLSLSPQRIDIERATWEAMDPNLRHKPRLLSEEELPSWLLKDEDEVGNYYIWKNFFNVQVGFTLQQKLTQEWVKKMIQ